MAEASPDQGALTPGPMLFILNPISYHWLTFSIAEVKADSLEESQEILKAKKHGMNMENRQFILLTILPLSHFENDSLPTNTHFLHASPSKGPEGLPRNSFCLRNRVLAEKR